MVPHIKIEEALNALITNDDEEAALQEYFKEEWIQYREWKE